MLPIGILSDLADRLRASWEGLEVNAWGHMGDGEQGRYIDDDSDYGRVDEDSRPEWLRKEYEGWVLPKR